jgi:diguanylate cyclase (GGDEF)-like protein
MRSAPARDSGAVATAASPSRSSPATSARPKSPAEKPVRTSTVQRFVERVPTELLAALGLACLIAAAMSLVWLRERSRVRAATRQAQVDPLTGIPNRLAFENRLGHEFKRARRYDRPLGMLMLDLDGLKQVNDTKGHDAGDQLIRSAAELISGDTRESDLAARLAGDEFVVLCPESPGEGLRQLSTKLHNRLQFAGIDASIGWAELTDSDMRAEDMMQRADASMYREKESRTATRSGLMASQGLATAG